MSTEPENGIVNIEQESRKHHLLGCFGQHSLLLSAIIGALFAVLLPIIVLVWKIDLCNYGPETDYGGVILYLPPFIVLGAALGFLAGLLGKGIGSLINSIFAIRSAGSIGTISGVILAALLGVLASIVPAFMFAFPDC